MRGCFVLFCFEQGLSMPGWLTWNSQKPSEYLPPRGKSKGTHYHVERTLYFWQVFYDPCPPSVVTQHTGQLRPLHWKPRSLQHLLRAWESKKSSGLQFTHCVRVPQCACAPVSVRGDTRTACGSSSSHSTHHSMAGPSLTTAPSTAACQCQSQASLRAMLKPKTLIKESSC